MSEPAPDEQPPAQDVLDDASETPPAPTEMSYAQLVTALGFDPEMVSAVVLTANSVVAISTDYPEPYVPPEATS